jgi:hypothetical protein
VDVSRSVPQSRRETIEKKSLRTVAFVFLALSFRSEAEESASVLAVAVVVASWRSGW